MPEKFKLIINAGSGHEDKEQALAKIGAALAEASIPLEIIRLDKGDNFQEKTRHVVETARRDGSVVVAAGGDGTINMVASFCSEHKVPMAIIPLGTFNFFARDLGIPVDLDGAINVLVNGQIRPAAIGRVGSQVFLVHVGIGLYADIIRNREKDKSRFGRFRIVALFSSFWSLLTTRKIYTVTIETEHEKITRRTLNVFVGNNALQLEKIGLAAARELPDDHLSIVILKPLSILRRIRLALLGIFRSMDLEPQIERLSAKSFTLETRRPHLKAAIDGELISLKSPLEFACASHDLLVMIPQGGAQ